LIQQVKKIKDLEPLSSFHFGLTQLEEEQRNVTASSSGGDKNMERKTGEGKGKEKKHHKKKQKTKAQDSNEGSSDDENAKQRVRHKMSIPKVYKLIHSVNDKRRK